MAPYAVASCFAIVDCTSVAASLAEGAGAGSGAAEGGSASAVPLAASVRAKAASIARRVDMIISSPCSARQPRITSIADALTKAISSLPSSSPRSALASWVMCEVT